MKKGNHDGGIRRLYKCDTESHIIFGAVHFARMAQPNKEVKEVVSEVVKYFTFDITVEAATMRYYRVLNAYTGEPETL
jgi:hypothetical protein